MAMGLQACWQIKMAISSKNPQLSSLIPCHVFCLYGRNLWLQNTVLSNNANIHKYCFALCTYVVMREELEEAASNT